jgi:hypothetical protein
VTAEIAILNKEAIALAADSAVTAGEGEGMKIFTTANKIFVLSPTMPVGVMVYNNAQFIGVPWETIICEIGKNVPVDGFKTLDEYVRLFLAYFEKESYLFRKEAQEAHLMEHIYYCCGMTKDIIVDRVDKELEKRKPLNERSIKVLVAKVIRDELNDWRSLRGYEKSSSIKLDMSGEMVSHYRSSVRQVMDAAFQKIPMSRGATRNMFEIIKCFVSYGTDDVKNSGIVIAGFGEKEAFPSLRSFTFDGLFAGKLKYSKGSKAVIGRNIGASILPFAQSEMVSRFMEGVDPDYRRAEKDFMSELSDKFPDAIVKNLRRYNSREKKTLSERIKNECNRIFNAYEKGMDREIERCFTTPVTRVVAVLPKAEMARLAEALVNLTSIKRKFSSVSETVAEPIDVAVISKSDGFVWIRKKTYH